MIGDYINALIRSLITKSAKIEEIVRPPIKQIFTHTKPTNDTLILNLISTQTIEVINRKIRPSIIIPNISPIRTIFPVSSMRSRCSNP